MQQILTVEQILAILKGKEESLRMLRATPEYMKLEASERFTTSNDLRLGDAIQALFEIHEAILNIEFYSQVEGQTNAFNDSLTT
ncbi:hypothetical protein NIES4072_73500 [Nostoc commune NIES-4072]|uniref:Uncharacterized protein n=1 Tax=Nostoc commune NIES-4072 TaxID=2005467 RepID=A0A2R5G1N9_NOSCO|nr:hypothetical protein [Nostoc commune]BBD70899.1 hypothetical protein NIES4070_73100 [Nostoc commune HK-02]GBG23638.1 hypothetical protein NIES4072_73500 [Nostoc commune NIES-4072]